MKRYNTEEDLQKIQSLEQTIGKESRQSVYALGYHLMPPTGWLNDPNGLCQVGDVYHLFFQYAPYTANGAGLKYWGHYETKDFLHYKYTGVFLSPDEDIDKDGVFSGSALVEDDTMYLYYTGNVEHEGDYDYTTAGREGNTILVTSKDGLTASQKQCLLRASVYPDSLSCHVRDPKVFRHGNLYYMVLGARTRKDKGCVMIYTGTDPRHFHFSQFIETKEPFGYMWECPDIFCLEDHTFLSLSPQGLKSETLRFQNTYQSGYFSLPTKVSSDEKIIFDSVDSDTFLEWDMGFDFYAPQTFLDNKGRRILIGWIGNPDAPYTNPTIEENWQHTLTLPRQLFWDADISRILQRPITEICHLRKEKLSCDISENSFSLPICSELLIDTFKNEDFKLTINHTLFLQYECATSILSLSFQETSHTILDKTCAKGYGRTTRFAQLSAKGLTKLHLFLDASCSEIFINDGECVLTTRFYVPDLKQHKITCQKAEFIQAFSLQHFTYEGL